MVQALREHLVDEAYTRLECRSSPYYQNSSLYPAIDYFERILQFDSEGHGESRLDRLVEYLEQFNIGDPDEGKGQGHGHQQHPNPNRHKGITPRPFANINGDGPA